MDCFPAPHLPHGWLVAGKQNIPEHIGKSLCPQDEWHVQADPGYHKEMAGQMAIAFLSIF